MNRKRTLGWIAAILFAVIVVLFVGGYAVLSSSRFHRYVLSSVTENLSQSTGGTVTIQNFDFHPSKLTANVYGIIVRGTELPPQAPLLSVDRLTLQLKILSVLHRQVNLNELLIVHPVVHLLVGTDGALNIPSPKAPKDTGSRTDIFDLAVGHVGLNDGEIIYNDVKIPLQAQVDDLATDIRFESLGKGYRGSLAYKTGCLQYGSFQPLPHSLNAGFLLTASEASLSSFDLRVGNSQATATAKVTNYGHPTVNGSYRLSLHPEDFAGMVQNASAKGDVTLAGSVHYQDSAQPLLKNIVLDGDLEGKEIRLSTTQAQLEVSSMHGRYQLANGNLAVQHVSARLLDGSLLADVSMQHLESTPAVRVRAQIEQISVPRIRQSLKAANLQKLPIRGVIAGTAQALWVGSISRMKADSNLVMHGAIENQSGTPPVPLSVSLHALYEGSGNRITLKQTAVEMPSSSIHADGQLSNRSNLAVHARTSDLQELVPLANSFGGNGTPISVSGLASMDAVVHGSLQHPSLNAQVSGRDIRVEGSSWTSMQASLIASASQISVQNAALISARQGRINANATVALKDWSYTPTSAIRVAASIRQMPVADLQQLARLDYPVSGIVSGDLDLQGSQLAPIGNGTLQLTKGEAYDQPIQNLTVKFQGTGETIRSTLALATPAGSASGDLAYAPKTRSYNVNFNAPKVVLQQLQAVKAKNLAVTGSLAASAHGAGTVDDPHLIANVQIPNLQFRETTIRGIQADLNVANHLATFNMGSSVSDAFVKAHAVVKLAGDYYTEANIDSSRVSLEPLLAAYVSRLPTGAQAQIELHASLKGPIKDKARLEAHLQIPTLEARYQQLQIENAAPVRLDLANNVLTIQPSELKGTETSLKIQGRIPVETDRAMDLTAQGQVNLKLLRILVPDVQSAGTINLDLHGTGNFNQPGVKGQVRLANVALTTSEAPLGVEKLNGMLEVANGQIHVTQLTGQSGGGQISGSGTIAYQPQVQFNLALNAKGVRLLYPTGLRSVFDGDLSLTGNRESAAVNGKVLVDSLSFTPDFDLASFAAQASTPSLPPANPSFADNLKLNVGVQSSADLSAASSTVSLEGAVDLRVVGTAANPVVVGRTDLTSGDVFFAGQRYQLERGLINFANPSQTEPYLNVLITTTIEQYALSLTIVGPMEKLETKYTSDPPLPPVDIINLIARGRTTEESVPGSFSANQVLAQGLASQVSSRIGKLAGISSLTIDPLLGGNNQNPSARVAIQQRLTRNFIFTFSTDVTQPQSEIVQGEYQINKRWSVSATRDQYGGFAFDGRYHTSF